MTCCPALRSGVSDALHHIGDIFTAICHRLQEFVNGLQLDQLHGIALTAESFEMALRMTRSASDSRRSISSQIFKDGGRVIHMDTSATADFYALATLQANLA